MITRRLLVLIGLLAFLASPVLGVEVTAEGEAAIFGGNLGSAKKQALLNAQRAAVEQGVGMLIDSKTVAKNFEIIKDEVLTSSQGFVEKYKIIDEGRSADGSSFRVKIQAVVSEKLLENRLEALRILHKKMGNKRVMVVYQSQNQHAMPRNHGATTAALQSLRDKLNQAGFRVINEKATEQIYRQIEGGTRPVEDVVAMALDQRADVLVVFEHVGGKRNAGKGLFGSAFSTLRVSVFDTNTGRQIADAQVEGKQLVRANAGPYDWEKGLSSASESAASQAAEETIGKIADYYKNLGDQGTAYLIVFKGFPADKKDLILDFLENTPGFQQLSELRNNQEFLEIELFTGQDSSRLRRIIRAGLKKQGINLQLVSSTPNRFIFSNPDVAE